MMTPGQLAMLGQIAEAIQALAAGAAEMIREAQGAPEEEAPTEEQPRRPRFLGDDDEPKTEG